MKNSIGSFTAKAAAFLLAFGCAGSAWGATVAQIGSTTYETLDAAIDAAATSGTTITLLDDAELGVDTIAKSFKIESNGRKITLSNDVTLNTGKTIIAFTDLTIDLAGHAISASGTGKIQCGEYYHKASTLTIEDSATGGRITGGNSSSAPLTQYGNGSVIVLKDDVAVNGTYLGITSGGGQIIVNDSATVYGGIYGVKNTATGDGVTDLYYSGEAVSGGTLAAWGPAEVTVGGKTYYAKTVSALVPKVPSDGTEYTITAHNSDATLSGTVVQGGQRIVVDLGSCVSSLRDDVKIYEGHLTIRNGTVNYGSQDRLIMLYSSADDTKNAGEYNSLTIADDAKITTTVVVYPSGYNTSSESGKAYGTKVVVNGEIVGTGSGAISINGVAHEGNSVIEVNGTVTNDKGLAIYLAGHGATYINASATVSGTTGIEVRAGELNVAGGSIAGTGASAINVANNSGASTSGAGIAVAQHTTQLPISVNVSGGTITGASSLYVVNPQGNTSDNAIDVSVSGNAAFSGEVVVTDARADVEIVGGLFSADPSAYVADGYAAVELTEGGDYNAGYRYAVGKVVASDLVPAAGATETEATYNFSVVVTNETGKIGTLATEQTVTVRVDDEHSIADITLNDFDISDVLASAVSAVGTGNENVTVDLRVSSAAVSGGKVTFEAHPEAVIQVGTATPEVVTLTNDELADGATFSLKFYTGESFAVGTLVKITHKSADYEDEVFIASVAEDTAGRYVPVTVSHFSTFEIEPFTPDAGMVAVNSNTGVQYATLAEAVAAVPTDGTATTIIMLADVGESVTISSGKNVVLDLNGQTITGDGSNPAITNSGILTIQDTSANADGVVSGGAKAAISTGGTFIMTSGVLDNTGSGTSNPTFLQTAGEASISGGKVQAVSYMKYAIRATGGTVSLSGTVLVNAKVSSSSASVAITGGGYKSTGSSSVTLPTGYLAQGYTFEDTPDSDGYYHVVELTEENATAKVVSGGTTIAYYLTVKDALSGAADGDTVVLLKNSTGDQITYGTDKAVTLDLNGKTYTVSTQKTTLVVKNGSLTITDSSQAGNGALVSAIDNAIQVQDGASLTIAGGNVQAANVGIFAIGPTSGNAQTRVNITGGTVTASGEGTIITNGDEGNAQHIAISISGGRVENTGSGAAIYNPNRGTAISVSDNAVITGPNGIALKGGTLNISGGQISGTGAYDAAAAENSGFTPTGDAIYVEDTYSANGNNFNPTVTITGGTLTSANGYAAQYYTQATEVTASQANGSINISGNPTLTSSKQTDAVNSTALPNKVNIEGGSFAHAVPEEYCADGYIPAEKDSETGMYTVKTGSYVAQNTTTGEKFETLAEAIAAVQDGDTIELLKDVEWDGTGAFYSLNVAGSVTIDGKGHTLSAPTSGGPGNSVILLGDAGATSRNDGKSYTIRNLTVSGFSGLSHIVRIQGVNATIENCNFEDNTASTDIVASDFSNLALTDSTFAGNSVSGAATVNVGYSSDGDTTSTTTITGNLFDGNTSTTIGEVYINDAQGASEIDGNTFRNNVDALAVVFVANSADVTGNLFAGNRITGSQEKLTTVVVGPWGASSVVYEVNVTGNAFDGNAHDNGSTFDVYLESFAGSHSAAFDVNGNYWKDGVMPVAGSEYAYNTVDGANTAIAGVKTYATAYDVDESGRGAGVTLEVCPVAKIGSNYYTTLAAALKAAEDGDTIAILDGTWGADAIGSLTTQEKLAIRAKSLTIQAAEGATPKFTADVSLGYDDSSTRNASIVVKGLAFENALVGIGNYAQTTVEGCSFVNSPLLVIESCASNYNRDDFMLDQVTIKDCTFDGTPSGEPAIRVRNSGNLLITGNTIENAGHNGILLESNGTVNTQVSKTVIIENNEITEWNAGNVADGGRGIRASLGTLAEGSTVTVEGNTFRKEQVGLDEPDFVKISGAGAGTVDISGNDWNDMLLSEVNGNSAIYTSDSTSAPVIDSVITTKKEPVAQIGTTKYESLAAAVAAVPTDGTETTITMLAGETIVADAGITIAAGKNIVLDLNGQTVQMTAASADERWLIKNEGSLTVKDSAENGKLLMSATGQASTAVRKSTIKNMGSLTVESGTIELTYSGTTKEEPTTILNDASDRATSLTVKGGTVVNSANRGTGVYLAVNDTNATVVDVQGGRVEGYGSAVRYYFDDRALTDAKLTFSMSNGTIHGRGMYGIHGMTTSSKDWNGISFDISGGTISCAGLLGRKHVISPLQGAVSISGGTFSGDVYIYGHALEITDGDFAGSVTLHRTKESLESASISGGQFSSGLTIAETTAENTTNPYYNAKFITGGIYGTAPEARNVVDEYAVVDNTDSSTQGDYPKTIGGAAASVTAEGNTTYYATLTDAIAAANEAEVDEITILDNTSESPDSAWKVADGKLVRKVYVAQIGSTKYESLAEAVAVAQKEDTITLLANVSETAVLPYAVMLDKNGFTCGELTAATGYAVVNFSGNTDLYRTFMDNWERPDYADLSWFTANTDASAFEISTAAQLAGLAQLVNGKAFNADGTKCEAPARDSLYTFYKKTITLTADVDLSAHGWVPIGTDPYSEDSSNKSYTDNMFSGTFDGGNHTIAIALNEQNSIYDFDALFGSLTRATIKNLALDATISYPGTATAGTWNADVYGGACALASYAAQSVVSNVTMNGTALLGTRATAGGGGLVSFAYYGTSFFDCTNNATVSIRQYYRSSTSEGYVVWGGIANQATGGGSDPVPNVRFVRCVNNASVTMENPYNNSRVLGKADNGDGSMNKLKNELGATIFYSRRLFAGGMVGLLANSSANYLVHIVDCEDNGTVVGCHREKFGSDGKFSALSAKGSFYGKTYANGTSTTKAYSISTTDKNNFVFYPYDNVYWFVDVDTVDLSACTAKGEGSYYRPQMTKSAKIVQKVNGAEVEVTDAETIALLNLSARLAGAITKESGTRIVLQTTPHYVAQIGDVKYRTFAEAIAAADEAVAGGGEDPVIMVLDAAAEQANSDWKFAENDTKLVRKVYVAQILRNEEVVGKYETLLDAYDHTLSGDTIEMIADDRLGEELAISRSVTITGAVDEDGKPLYTIYGKPTDNYNVDVFIKNASSAIDVTIQNVNISEFGHQYKTSTENAALYVSRSTHADTHVLVSNVTFSAYNNYAIIAPQGHLEVVDCAIDGYKDSSYGTFATGGIWAGDMFDDLPSSTVSVVRTSIINTDSNMPGVTGYAIDARAGSTVTVTDCTITNVHDGIAAAASQESGDGEASVSVSGTTVTASRNALAITGNPQIANTVLAYLKVTSGMFAGAVTIPDEFVDDGIIEISGGLFDRAVPEEYCADGYIPVDNTDEETSATYPYTVTGPVVPGYSAPDMEDSSETKAEGIVTVANGVVSTALSKVSDIRFIRAYSGDRFVTLRTSDASNTFELPAGFGTVTKVVAYCGENVTATAGAVPSLSPQVDRKGNPPCATGSFAVKSGVYYSLEANGVRTALHDNKPVAPEEDGDSLNYSVPVSPNPWGVVKFRIIVSDEPLPAGE